MRRPRWIVFLVVVISIPALIVGRVGAAESRSGDVCVVPADQIIPTDFYVVCNTLTIEGTIDGDLIGGAWSTTIAPGGRVTGDIWLFGGQLRIDGTVEDDIHFAGVDLDLTEQAQLAAPLDVSAFAINVEVAHGATVPGDLIVAGYQTLVRGRVEGGVNFNGTALVVEGEVEDNVHAVFSGSETPPSFIPFPFPFSVSFQPSGLTVRPEGQVGGWLSYSGPRAGDIQGQVAVETTFDQTVPRPDITVQTTSPADVFAGYLNAALIDVLSLMTAGILALLVAPAWLRGPAQIIPRRPLPSLGWGLLTALLAVPVSLILLLFSVAAVLFLAVVTLGGFTIMAALLLSMLNVGVIGGLAFVIFFVSRLVTSMLIGRALGRRLIRATDPWVVNLLSLLLGVILYALLTNFPIPWLNAIVNAVGILIGLGAIVLHARQLYEQATRPAVPVSAATTALVPVPSQALDALRGRTPPPPPESAEPPGPGMENLPSGFDFDFWER